MCIVLGCNEPSVSYDPIELCQKHFDEWELAEAENEADRASARLEQVQKRHKRKSPYYEPEMTERIKP